MENLTFWLEAVKTVGYPIASALGYWFVIRQNNKFFQSQIEKSCEDAKSAQQLYAAQLDKQRTEMMQFVALRDDETNKVLYRLSDALDDLKNAWRTPSRKNSSHLKIVS